MLQQDHSETQASLIRRNPQRLGFWYGGAPLLVLGFWYGVVGACGPRFLVRRFTGFSPCRGVRFISVASA